MAPKGKPPGKDAKNVKESQEGQLHGFIDKLLYEKTPDVSTGWEVAQEVIETIFQKFD